jgi:hypothetical protein
MCARATTKFGRRRLETLSRFQGFSEPRLSLGGDHDRVNAVARQIDTAQVRDVAVQKLRDLTIAVAIVAAAGVGAIAWISAATIPGSNGLAGLVANPITDRRDRSFSDDDGFNQAPPTRAQSGPAVAVSGGSHP